MLVPWDVWQRVVESANRALEEDHAESGLQDFRMIGIAIERLTEFRDGCISMAHDVVINLLALDIHRGFAVLGRNAETAVQVTFVALQSRQNVVCSCRSVLICLENREDGGKNIGDEVIKKSLITFVKLDSHLADGLGWAVAKVKEVCVENLFR